MNSQRTKNDEKKSGRKNNSSILTKETLGVVIILFTTLCLVCLLTGDGVFFAPGKYIRNFLMGLFGYFSYLVSAWLITMGIRLVTGKSFNIPFKRKLLLVAAVAAAACFAHVLTLGGGIASYGEYLSASYSLGEDKFSAGGVVTGLYAYFLQSLLSVIGSAVVAGVIFAIVVYFLIKNMAAGKTAKTSDRGFKGSYIRAEETPVVSETDDGAAETDKKEISSETPADNNGKRKVQRLFINDGNEFGYKTRKEMAKPDGTSLTVNAGASATALNVSGYTQSYSESRNAEMQKKLEYIKTPTPINIEERNYGQNSPRVSDYIAPRREQEPTRETPAKDDTPREIPMIEHDESFRENAASRARSFGDRYVNGFNRNAASEEEKFAVNGTDNAAGADDRTKEVSETETRAADFSRRAGRFTEETEETETTETPSAAVDNVFGETAEDNAFGGANVGEGRLRSERIINFDETEAEESSVDTTSEDNDIADEKTDEPPVSRLRENGARRMFIGDEKPAFTSRVRADNNAIAGFNDEPEEKEETEFAEEPEEIEVKEDKPAPPINREYFRPPLDLLETHTPPADAPQENHEERIETIKRVLEEFHINVEPQGYVQGPTITRYEVKMPAGVTVKRVLGYDDDLKMRLQSKAGVRIEAPIPGKDLVGIEVANKCKVTVGLKEVLEGAAGQKIKSGSLMFALGKDIVGNSIMDNLAKGPHFLVAGATGSGKSVCLNVMIVSMLMRYSPEELRLILIDPKRVGFRKYEHLPHLMIDEIVTEPPKAVAVLKWAYQEMERRYGEFEKIEGGLVSDIESYNELVASDTVAKMPRIVIVVDELADLMETCKRDMEAQIRLLAQKSRAAGIHLVLATQRPSVDVVTGTIKANLPSRIALKVMNFADSSTILAEGGAEKLLGNGDMLYKNSGMSEPERYQGAWISDREISNVVTYIKEHNAAYYDDGLKEFLDKTDKPQQEETAVASGGDEENGGFDDFFLKALWLAITSNSVSIAQLQRRFQIGYARAGGLVDKMERYGFVSPNEGSKARRVLITREEYESRFGPAPDND